LRRLGALWGGDGAGTGRGRGCARTRGWRRCGWVCQKHSQRPERCNARKLATAWTPGRFQRMPAPLARAAINVLHVLSTAPEPMGNCRATKRG